MKEVHYCSICGEVLTSARSIKRGYGQRCGWKKYGRRKRSSNVSQGSPISDVSFKVSGGKGYVQLSLGDFE
jgi:predicted  nucleic acid-binding Zn-ribbon protein